jgi:hypothetical protein
VPWQLPFAWQTPSLIHCGSKCSQAIAQPVRAAKAIAKATAAQPIDRTASREFRTFMIVPFLYLTKIH